MTLHRRTALRIGGTAALTSLSGCSALARLLSGGRRYEYTLTVDDAAQSLVEHALFDPDAESPFADSTRAALDAILPDGRHVTSGYEPLPSDAYVTYDGRYFQTDVVVTGRERVERTLVRAEPVDADAVPDDARSVEDLPRASGRVVEILHGYHSTDGEGSAADLLHGDAYVLRRPAERDGPIADDLDGEVVRVDADGPWAYRIDRSTEPITETVYETFAVEVAPDRAAFREVALATRVDATVDPSALGPDARSLLESTIDGQRHHEETPLSDEFSVVVGKLGLEDVTVGENGLYLWYDESLYRYGLYVHPLD